MKYLYYIWLLLIGLFIKVLSPLWYWVIIPYRARARSVVYNYVCKHNVYVKDIYRKGCLNNLTKHNVNILQYMFYKWFVWIWINDRATYDTFSHTTIWGYVIRNKHSKNPITKYIHDKLIHIDYNKLKQGSAFILGSIRSSYPVDNFIAQSVYMSETSDSNFDYMYYVTDDPKKVFYFKIGNLEFGWKASKSTLGGVSYNMYFGKILVEDV